MAVTPDTDLRLLIVPIEIDNKNQLTFASKEAQASYFLGLPNYVEANDTYYQRQNNVIEWPAHIDSIIQYNYVMYKNNNYSNKWFYAFVVDMKYINDGLTEITIQTDVFQTWQFVMDWKQSFIEREMIAVSNDTIGANRIPENFETGEYIINKKYSFNIFDVYYVIAYAGDSIKRSSGGNLTVNCGFKLNGVYQSVGMIVCNDTGFATMMSYMNYEDNSNNILTIFTIPKCAFNIVYDWSSTGYYIINENNFTAQEILDSSDGLDALTTSFEFEKPQALIGNGYTPRNKKLLQYPYVYLGLNPISGNNKIYRYEDFSSFQPKFEICSEINPNPSVLTVPIGYRLTDGFSTATGTEDTGLISGYPTISYKTDVFNTWLAQNQGIIDISMNMENTNFQQQKMNQITGASQQAMNTASNVTNQLIGGNVGGSITSLLGGALSSGQSGSNLAFTTKNHENNIAMQMAQIEKQRMLPDNITLGSSATALGFNLLDDNIFSQYCIRREFAEKIDKYFDMYGYLTNTVKLPNLTNRPNWNYIKTIGANIVGAIPQVDLQAIKDMFDNGITLWHNPATFLDYSQNNR